MIPSTTPRPRLGQRVSWATPGGRQKGTVLAQDAWARHTFAVRPDLPVGPRAITLHLRADTLQVE